MRQFQSDETVFALGVLGRSRSPNIVTAVGSRADIVRPLFLWALLPSLPAASIYIVPHKLRHLVWPMRGTHLGWRIERMPASRACLPADRIFHDP